MDNNDLLIRELIRLFLVVFRIIIIYCRVYPGVHFIVFHILHEVGVPTTVMIIRSVKILLVSNTDFFGKLAKIGQYLVSILGKSQFI